MLEKCLQTLNVKRQAFQGGTFVGNHMHKLLKVKVHKVKTSLLIHLSLLSQSLHCVTASRKVLQTIQVPSLKPIAFPTSLPKHLSCLANAIGYTSSHCLSNEDIDQLGKLKQFTYLG